MDLFTPLLSQMVFLFAFIAIGFIFAKWKFVPDDSARVLSRLENLLFIPALVMGTFITNCTVETLGKMWKLLLMSFITLAVLIPVSLVCAKFIFKENYLRKIATYGLSFSNFAYMGNAIVSAVFPSIFSDYLIYCLPFWLLIYLWGVPVLLISGSGEEKRSIKDSLKNLVNPMLVATLIGIALGLTGWGRKLPSAVLSVITVSGNCMSPVAMLLTGMTLGKLDVLALIKKWRIYVMSGIKLVAYPLLFILVFLVLPRNQFIDTTFLTCALCVAAMPLGLNTIVVPAGYGKDVSDAAGMALVTHVLSIITIPLVFMLFQAVIL